MNEKEQLIQEIEQAPDFLVKAVLDFLLLTKSKTKYLKFSRDRNLEIQLSAMSEDREVQAEISTINQETTTTKSEKSLKSLLLEIPKIGEDSDFERTPDLGRDIYL